MSNKFQISNLKSQIALLFIIMLASCTSEAKWTDKDVHITMDVHTVSAGFIECSFSTDKEAYYLIAIQPADDEFDPMVHQKQFMTLALDSAHAEYLNWRYWLLKDGEFNIASFASHVLKYGKTEHFFTNLSPDTEYWVYAFVVNPETMKPVGKLTLQSVTTKSESIYDVHFEYRVRGMYDYIYPIDDLGRINNHFPYVVATRDSTFLRDSVEQTPVDYFTYLFLTYSALDLTSLVRYGVNVTKNDGQASDEAFVEGHTYYTAIVSFDGFFGNNVIYKFTWGGDDFEAYFTDENDLVSHGQDW